MVVFLREAIRAIASLGCKGAMRAIGLKHVATSLPPAGPHTNIQCCNCRRHNNRSNRQRRGEDTANDPNSCKANRPRDKGYCTYRVIFTRLRCTTDVLLFSCCDSVAAHFKHAATRQPRRKPTVETCVDNTAKLRPQASVLALRAAGVNQLLKPSSTTPRSYGRRHRSWLWLIKFGITRLRVVLYRLYHTITNSIRYNMTGYLE